jgi:hypothetical protein
MPSPHNKRQLKSERVFSEHTPAAGSKRHAELKVKFGLSAKVERPVFGDEIARRNRGRSWSKPEAPSQ